MEIGMQQVYEALLYPYPSVTIQMQPLNLCILYAS